MEELLTTKELAEYLKISSITIIRWRKKGLPFVKAGNQVRFEKDKVKAWLNEIK